MPPKVQASAQPKPVQRKAPVSVPKPAKEDEGETTEEEPAPPPVPRKAPVKAKRRPQPPPALAPAPEPEPELDEEEEAEEEEENAAPRDGKKVRFSDCESKPNGISKHCLLNGGKPARTEEDRARCKKCAAAYKAGEAARHLERVEVKRRHLSTRKALLKGILPAGKIAKKSFSRCTGFQRFSNEFSITHKLPETRDAAHKAVVAAWNQLSEEEQTHWNDMCKEEYETLMKMQVQYRERQRQEAEVKTSTSADKMKQGKKRAAPDDAGEVSIPKPSFGWVLENPACLVSYVKRRAETQLDQGRKIGGPQPWMNFYPEVLQLYAELLADRDESLEA